jgi:hypothetical protein
MVGYARKVEAAEERVETVSSADISPLWAQYPAQ